MVLFFLREWVGVRLAANGIQYKNVADPRAVAHTETMMSKVFSVLQRGSLSGLATAGTVWL